MRFISDLSPEQLKLVNKFLKSKDIKPFSKKFINYIKDDLLDVCYRSDIFVKGSISLINMQDLMDCDIDENHYCIHLNTCLQTADLLVLDSNFEPFKLVIDHDMDKCDYS